MCDVSAPPGEVLANSQVSWGTGAKFERVWRRDAYGCATHAQWWMHSRRLAPGMRIGVPGIRAGACIVSAWRQECALLCQACVWCAMNAYWWMNSKRLVPGIRAGSVNIHYYVTMALYECCLCFCFA